MHIRRWTLALSLGSFLVAPSLALAAPKIGNVTTMKNEVTGVAEGNTRRLNTGSEIYSEELIKTGTDAVSDLAFIDNTRLTVGPISEVRLDKFVYDPTGANGTVVIKVTKGAFRFVTGVQDHRAYNIQTPYGTLGVRGTVFEVTLGDDCRDLPPAAGQPPSALDRNCMKLKLVDGAVTVTTNNGSTVDVTTPNTSVTVNSAGTFSSPAPSPSSILNFASNSQGNITTGSVGGGGGGGGGVGGPTGAGGAPTGGTGNFGGGGGTGTTGGGTANAGPGLTGGLPGVSSNSVSPSSR